MMPLNNRGMNKVSYLSPPNKYRHRKDDGMIVIMLLVLNLIRVINAQGRPPTLKDGL